MSNELEIAFQSGFQKEAQKGEARRPKADYDPRVAYNNLAASVDSAARLGGAATGGIVGGNIGSLVGGSLSSGPARAIPALAGMLGGGYAGYHAGSNLAGGALGRTDDQTDVNVSTYGNMEKNEGEENGDEQ